MKKLILVIALAIAASWMLTENRPMETATLESVAMPEIVRAPEPVLLVRDDDRTSGLVPGPETSSRIIWPQDAPGWKVAPGGRQAPSWFPKSDADEETKARADSFGSRVLLGRLSASEDRARDDLRQIVEREVSAWLAADVPPSWKAPAQAIRAMVQASFVQEVTKNLVPTAAEGESSDGPKVDGLFTLYRAGQKLDFSPTSRAEIVGLYRKDLASGRMQRLGGGLALALVGLAVLSGYIKADEVTKGYYTKRLRLAAAAGLGVASVAAYRFLV